MHLLGRDDLSDRAQEYPGLVSLSSKSCFW